MSKRSTLTTGEREPATRVSPPGTPPPDGRFGFRTTSPFGVGIVQAIATRKRATSKLPKKSSLLRLTSTLPPISSAASCHMHALVAECCIDSTLLAIAPTSAYMCQSLPQSAKRKYALQCTNKQTRLSRYIVHKKKERFDIALHTKEIGTCDSRV
jgi:hypothetical protein